MQTDRNNPKRLPPGKIESLHDLISLFESIPIDVVEMNAAAFATEISRHLESIRLRLIDVLEIETGLTTSDSQESVDGVLAYLRAFRAPSRDARSVSMLTQDRTTKIVSAPWGTVVAILPQNAFLYLGLVCLTQALASGNRVVLRIPSGSRESASLLASAFAEIGDLAAHVHLVDAPAPDLLKAFYDSKAPGLVHYFGGSGRIGEMSSDAFRAGKGFIGDGEGNTWVYVDETCDPAFAAETLLTGATRYGGQTCTSVNGCLVHPHLYDQVRGLLLERFGRAAPCRQGSDQAARACVDTLLASGGEILAGARTQGASVAPTLIDAPATNSKLVEEGVFGPGLWVAPGTAEEFRRLWLRNRYPLCAAVLGQGIDPTTWSQLPNLARLVVNGDPSLEDPLEPWGGYPSSGNSNVVPWSDKYSRTVQIDLPI